MKVYTVIEELSSGYQTTRYFRTEEEAKRFASTAPNIVKSIFGIRKHPVEAAEFDDENGEFCIKLTKKELQAEA